MIISPAFTAEIRIVGKTNARREDMSYRLDFAAFSEFKHSVERGLHGSTRVKGAKSSDALYIRGFYGVGSRVVVFFNGFICQNIICGCG